MKWTVIDSQLVFATFGNPPSAKYSFRVTFQDETGDTWNLRGDDVQDAFAKVDPPLRQEWERAWNEHLDALMTKYST